MWRAGHRRDSHRADAVDVTAVLRGIDPLHPRAEHQLLADERLCVESGSTSATSAISWVTGEPSASAAQ